MSPWYFVGIPIPLSAISMRIFSPFLWISIFANETSKGSGLGLYIVKNAVEKLGGTIKIKSNPNAGTTFTIYLPLDQQLNHEN